MPLNYDEDPVVTKSDITIPEYEKSRQNNAI